MLVICQVALAGVIVTIVVFIVNRRSQITLRLYPTFTFVIDLDFQLSSGRRWYNSRIFLQSSNLSGEEPTTTRLPNTTIITASPADHQEVPSSTRTTTLNNQVIDNHQVQFDLENLPNDWPTLGQRWRLPPIVIIEEEHEEEIVEDQLYPIWEGPEPSTPSWYDEEYRESHDPN